MITNIFNGKAGIILSDTTALAAGHNSSFELKAGDTATVISWHARNEFLKEYPKTKHAPDVAKILPACSEHTGRICYIRHWEFFVIPEDLQNKLTGKSFCITGTLSYPREVYASVIQFCGGDFKKSVTKNLDYLIMARTDTVKAQKAKEEGIQCVTEKEFKTKILGLLSGEFKNWVKVD